MCGFTLKGRVVFGYRTQSILHAYTVELLIDIRLMAVDLADNLCVQ